MFDSATQNKCFSSLLNQWMNYTNFKTRIQKYENSQGPTFRTISTGTWLFSRRTTENFWHSATRARSKKRTGCRSMYSAHWRLLSRQLFSVAPKAPWFRKVMPSSRSNAVPIKALISWTLGTYIGTFNGTSFSCAGNLSSCSIYLASPIRKGWYQPLPVIWGGVGRMTNDKTNPKFQQKQAPPARNAFALLRRSGHLDLHWQHLGTIIS